MKRMISLVLLLSLLLTACAANQTPEAETSVVSAIVTEEPTQAPETEAAQAPEAEATEPAQMEEPTQAPEAEEAPARILPELQEPKDTDFVAVRDYLPDVLVDLRYAGENNFTGRQLYDFSEPFLRYGTVKKLMAVCQELEKEGLRLKIWDAFRPAAAQFQMWETMPDPIYVANPTERFSAHTRGNTIDATLTNLAGNELAMPTDFDDFTTLANRDYADVPQIAADNARMFEEIMTRHGFAGYFGEWWHFTDTQDYEAEEHFDPAALSTWTAECEEFITLRAHPSTAADAITTIPVGEQLTVLGWDGEFALADYQGLRGYVLASYIKGVSTIQMDMPKVWLPNCNEFISLRPAPGSSDTVVQIKKDEPINFLGWAGKYARVQFARETEDGPKQDVGYVLANYIFPGDKDWFANHLDLVKVVEAYPHSLLLKDAAKLAELYPDYITLDTIGTSEEGRDIPVLRLGSEDASHHVLIQGAIHGREHMTAWLLMALVDYWADNGLDTLDICWHIIPMVNPDGVTISQNRYLTEGITPIYQADLKGGFTQAGANTYVTQWKANALGIDLNRSFPAGWDTLQGPESPSSQGYRGTEPLQAAEAKALADYAQRYAFDATVSYHASGCEVYAGYGDKQPVNDLSRSLGRKIALTTGYDLVDSQDLPAGGFKDWAVDTLEIPSITIEIGSYEAPLALREAYATFIRNISVFPEIAQWLQEN